MQEWTVLCAPRMRIKKGRHSISCISPVASKAGIARFILLLVFFSLDTMLVMS